MASTRASISKASKRPKINIIPPKQLFVDLTHDDTKTPSLTLQLSSPSTLNAPSKKPLTNDTSSSLIDYILKSPTSSTSLSPNGYLNLPTSLPLRVSPPPPTQENVNLDIPVKVVQDQLQRELEVQIFISKAFRAKAKAEREIRGDHVLHYSMLRDYVVELQSTNPNTTVKIAVERNTDPSLPTRVFQRIYCLCDDIDLHPNSNFTFTSDRQKGIISAIKTVYPSAEHRYCLRHIHENIKQGWCGQAYKDLLWRATSATNVRDFEKCMLELKTMNPKAHEWLNKIPAEHWARSYFLGRAKSDLLVNNICEVFNGKIVEGRDKPVITLLEYIREYCMKRIMNVQGVIDKCTGPLTPTATRIMESIKKEAHLMKVQWNEANKYQVSGLLGDQCVMDVVGRPKKKRKRSKHEDEPFVKDGKLSRKGRTITCQSCGNIRYNKATCKGQGRKETTGGNNAEGSGSASRQAQQTELVFGQVSSGGSSAGAVIGLSAAGGEGGEGDPGGAGVASQDGREMGDGVPTQSSAAGGASEFSFLSFQKLIYFRRVYVCNSSPHKWQTSKSTSVATV
ncbi:mutator type transposase [Tanacetum coccineum]